MAVTVERLVRADPAALWRVISDLERWADVLPTVTEIERIGDPGPVAVGSRFRLRQPGLAPATYEVTDWRPAAGFTWTARTVGVRTTATHEVRPDGNGARLRLGVEWAGPGAGLTRRLFAGKTRRLLEQEAATFADRAEEPADRRRAREN